MKPGKKRSWKRLRAMELLATHRYDCAEVALRLGATVGTVRAWAREDGIEVEPVKREPPWADVRAKLSAAVPGARWSATRTVASREGRR